LRRAGGSIPYNDCKTLPAVLSIRKATKPTSTQIHAALTLTLTPRLQLLDHNNMPHGMQCSTQW